MKDIIPPSLSWGSEWRVLNTCWRNRECQGLKRDKRKISGSRYMLQERVEKSTLKWFGHMKKMNEGRIVQQIFKDLVGHTSLNPQESKRRAKDRKDWKVTVFGRRCDCDNR